MVGWLKGIVKVLVLLPVVAAVVLLAVANRAPVTLILDPFARESPGLVYRLPLFALVLGAVVVGVLLGGIGAWLAQAKHRRAERQLRREAEQLRVEVARLKQQGAMVPVADLKAA